MDNPPPGSASRGIKRKWAAVSYGPCVSAYSAWLGGGRHGFYLWRSRERGGPRGRYVKAWETMSNPAGAGLVCCACNWMFCLSGWRWEVVVGIKQL